MDLLEISSCQDSQTNSLSLMKWFHIQITVVCLDFAQSVLTCHHTLVCEHKKGRGLVIGDTEVWLGDKITSNFHGIWQMCLLSQE